MRDSDIGFAIVIIVLAIEGICIVSARDRIANLESRENATRTILADQNSINRDVKAILGDILVVIKAGEVSRTSG